MSEFKELDERSHVLLRPSMYIGSTSEEEHEFIISGKTEKKYVVPGLLKIINEVLDNSVDEYVRTSGKFANKISLDINDTINGQEVVISDNGRGIPVKPIGESYIPVSAWTKARAGSNFTDDNRVTMGMNGVGSFATNCFSLRFIGETSDGENKIVVKCSDNCSKIAYNITKSTSNGTTVSFIPDLDRFQFINEKTISSDHLDVLRERIRNLSISHPGIQFKFNGEKIQFKNIKSVAESFHEHAIALTNKTGNISFVIAPSGATEEFKCLSYVNGLHIKNGGSHIDYILNELISHMRPAIKRKWKIEVLPNQIKQHLLIGSWITGFPNLKFDSQTKERITNSQSELSVFFKEIYDDLEVISKKIINNEFIINPMIEAILHKKELQERREAKEALKNAKKKRIIDHLEASSKNPEEKLLFIAEGLSAIGSLTQTRNSRIHGGYALRGKVMNTNGMKVVDIVSNRVYSELLTVIGLDIDDTEDLSNLQYGKICLLTDSDPDGDSIFCLLLQFFSRWPKLFEQKRICRVISPLYIAKKKNEIRSYYSREEYESEKDSLRGYEISYNKGLGSLEESDYESMINNPRIINVILSENRFDKLEMAFGDSADSRKEWMTK